MAGPEAGMTEAQRRRAMATILLTVVLDLVGFGLVIPLLPFYVEGFGATPEQVTQLMAGFSLAQFVFAPIWGQLSDRIGRRPVLVASIGLTAVFLALFASAGSLWMLLAFRVLHGVATANISTAQACMADLSARADRARAMGMIGAAFGLGFTIGPALGGGLSPDGFLLAPLLASLQAAGQAELAARLAGMGLTLPLWVAAGLSALNFVLALAVLPETRWAQAEPEAAAPARRFRIAGLVEALGDPRLGPMIALSFAQVAAFAMTESTFTLFAEHVHGLRPAKIGELFGVVGLVGIFVQGGLIRPLLARYGERPLITAGLAVLSVSLVLLPIAPEGAGLTAVFALMAIGQGVASPSISGLISRSADASRQGLILGSAQSAGALARVIGPAVGGVLFQRASYAAPFWVAAAVLGVGAALSIRATRRAVEG